MTLYIETGVPDAAYNFAFEEYCLAHIDADKIISIWQADNCVMIGRNQIAQNEINEEIRERLQPQIVRRSSGGGTIYTDMGTLLLTVISPVESLEEVDFSVVCAPFVTALQKMGIHASLRGRNDIFLDGKKISGNAQTVSAGKLCTHSSLLFDTDLDKLSEILRADESKIKSKAQPSIRSAVTTVAERLDSPIPMSEFWKRLKDALLSDEENIKEYILSDLQRKEIEWIKKNKYDTWEWTYGDAPVFNFENSKRFFAGRLTCRINVQKGKIDDLKLYGDFLGLSDISPLEKLFIGCIYEREAMRQRLFGVDLYPYLRGISSEELLECLSGN